MIAIGDVEWANLQIASAFVLGATLGALATIRIVRAVLGIFEPEKRRRRRPIVISRRRREP